MPHFHKLKRRSHKMFFIEEDVDLKDTTKLRNSNKSSFSEIPYENLHDKMHTTQKNGLQTQLSDTLQSALQDTSDRNFTNVIHSIGQNVSSIPSYKNNFYKTRLSINHFRNNSTGKDFYREISRDYDRSPDNCMQIRAVQKKSTSYKKNRIKTGKLSAFWPSKKAKVKDMSVSGGPCAFSKSPMRSPTLSKTFRRSSLGGESRALSIEPGLVPSRNTSNFFSAIDLIESRLTPSNFEVITNFKHKNSHSHYEKPEATKPKPFEAVKVFTSNLNSYRNSTEKFIKESSNGFFCLDSSINVRGRSISPPVTADIMIPQPISIFSPTPHIDHLAFDVSIPTPAPISTIEACNQASSRNAYYYTNPVDMGKGNDIIYSLDKVMITIKPKSKNKRCSTAKQEVSSPTTYKPTKVSLDDTRLLQNMKEERPKSGKMYGKIFKGRSFIFTSDGNKYPALKIVSKSII